MMTLDPRDSSVYFSTVGVDQNRIRKLSLPTGIMTTVAGTGVGDYAGDGGPATSALLSSPFGVAVDPKRDQLYFADSDNQVIRAVNLKTGTIRRFIGTGNIGMGNGQPFNTMLNYPTALLYDDVADTLLFYDNNWRVRHMPLDRVTYYTYTLTGSGTKGCLGDGNIPSKTDYGTIMQMYIRQEPPAIANGTAVVPAPTLFDRVLPPGKVLLMLDSHCCVLRGFNYATTTAFTLAGTRGVCTTTGDGGPALSASFNTPQGLAVLENRGLIFILEGRGYVLRRWDVVADTVDTVAGIANSMGFSGDSSSVLYPLITQMASPFGLVTIDNGTALVIADSGTRRLRAYGARYCSPLRAASNTTKLTALKAVDAVVSTYTWPTTAFWYEGRGSGTAWPFVCLWDETKIQAEIAARGLPATAASGLRQAAVQRSGLSFGIGYRIPYQMTTLTPSRWVKVPCDSVTWAAPSATDGRSPSPSPASLLAVDNLKCVQRASLTCFLPPDFSPDAGQWRVYVQLANASSPSSPYKLDTQNAVYGERDTVADTFTMHQRGGDPLNFPAPVIISANASADPDTTGALRVVLVGQSFGPSTTSRFDDPPEVSVCGVRCTPLGGVTPISGSDRAQIITSCPVACTDFWLRRPLGGQLRIANQATVFAVPPLVDGIMPSPPLTVLDGSGVFVAPTTGNAIAWGSPFTLQCPFVGAANPSELWIQPDDAVIASRTAMAGEKILCLSLKADSRDRVSCRLRILRDWMLGPSARWSLVLSFDDLVDGSERRVRHTYSNKELISIQDASFTGVGGGSGVIVGRNVTIQRPRFPSIASPYRLSRTGGDRVRFALPTFAIGIEDLFASLAAEEGESNPLTSFASKLTGLRVWLGHGELAPASCSYESLSTILCSTGPGYRSVVRATIELGGGLFNITSDALAPEDPIPLAAPDGSGKYLGYGSGTVGSVTPKGVFVPVPPLYPASPSASFFDFNVTGAVLAVAVQRGFIRAIAIGGVACESFSSRVVSSAGSSASTSSVFDDALSHTTCRRWNASRAYSLALAEYHLASGTSGFPDQEADSAAVSLFASSPLPLTLEITWGDASDPHPEKLAFYGRLTGYLRPTIVNVRPGVIARPGEESISLLGSGLCPPDACNAAMGDVAVFVAGKPCLNVAPPSADTAASLITCVPPRVPDDFPGYPFLPVTVVNAGGSFFTLDDAIRYPATIVDLLVTSVKPTTFIPSSGTGANGVIGKTLFPMRDHFNVSLYSSATRGTIKSSVCTLRATEKTASIVAVPLVNGLNKGLATTNDEDGTATIRSDSLGTVVIAGVAIRASFSTPIITIQVACERAVSASSNAANDGESLHGVEEKASFAFTVKVLPLKMQLCTAPTISVTSQDPMPVWTLAVGVDDSPSGSLDLCKRDAKLALPNDLPRQTIACTVEEQTDTKKIALAAASSPLITPLNLLAAAANPSALVSSGLFIQNGYSELREENGLATFHSLTVTGEQNRKYAVRAVCRVGVGGGAASVAIDAASGATTTTGALAATSASGGGVEIPGSYSFILRVEGCKAGFVPDQRLCRKCPSLTFSLGGEDTSCKSCPARGADCADGLLNLLPSFYRPPSELNQPISATSKLYLCPLPVACVVNATGGSKLLGLPASNNGTIGNSTAELLAAPSAPIPYYGCAEGYTGILCGSCEPGYGRFGVPCAPCWSDGSTRAAMALIVLVLIGACFFVASKTADAGTRSSASIALRILLGYVQALGAIRAFKNGGTDLFRSIFGWTDALWASPFSFGPVQCALGWSYITRFFLVILAPLLAALGVMIAYLILSFWRYVNKARIRASLCNGLLRERASERSGLRLKGKALRNPLSAPASGDSSAGADATPDVVSVTQQALENAMPGKERLALRRARMREVEKRRAAAAPRTPDGHYHPYVAWALWQEDLKRWWLERRPVSAVVFVSALAYMPIVANCIAALNCTPEPIDGVYYLQADLSVACYQGEHRIVYGFALFFLTVIGAGFPFIVILFLWRAGRKDVGNYDSSRGSSAGDSSIAEVTWSAAGTPSLVDRAPGKPSLATPDKSDASSNASKSGVNEVSADSSSSAMVVQHSVVFRNIWQGVYDGYRLFPEPSLHPSRHHHSHGKVQVQPSKPVEKAGQLSTVSADSKEGPAPESGATAATLVPPPRSRLRGIVNAARVVVSFYPSPLKAAAPATPVQLPDASLQGSTALAAALGAPISVSAVATSERSAAKRPVALIAVPLQSPSSPVPLLAPPSASPEDRKENLPKLLINTADDDKGTPAQTPVGEVAKRPPARAVASSAPRCCGSDVSQYYPHGLLWFEAAVLLRKMCVVLLASLVTDASAQLVGFTVLMQAALLLHLKLQPYKQPLFNTLEAIAIVATALTAVISVLLTRPEVQADGSLVVVATAVVGVTTGSLSLDSKRLLVTTFLVFLNVTALVVLGVVWLNYLVKACWRNQKTQQLVSKSPVIVKRVKRASLELASRLSPKVGGSGEKRESRRSSQARKRKAAAAVAAANLAHANGHASKALMTASGSNIGNSRSGQLGGALLGTTKTLTRIGSGSRFPPSEVVGESTVHYAGNRRRSSMGSTTMGDAASSAASMDPMLVAGAEQRVRRDSENRLAAEERRKLRQERVKRATMDRSGEAEPARHGSGSSASGSVELPDLPLRALTSRSMDSNEDGDANESASWEGEAGPPGNELRDLGGPRDSVRSLRSARSNGSMYSVGSDGSGFAPDDDYEEDEEDYEDGDTYGEGEDSWPYQEGDEENEDGRDDVADGDLSSPGTPSRSSSLSASQSPRVASGFREFASSVMQSNRAFLSRFSLKKTSSNSIDSLASPAGGAEQRASGSESLILGPLSFVRQAMLRMPTAGPLRRNTSSPGNNARASVSSTAPISVIVPPVLPSLVLLPPPSRPSLTVVTASNGSGADAGADVFTAENVALRPLQQRRSVVGTLTPTAVPLVGAPPQQHPTPPPPPARASLPVLGTSAALAAGLGTGMGMASGLAGAVRPRRRSSNGHASGTSAAATAPRPTVAPPPILATSSAARLAVDEELDGEYAMPGLSYVREGRKTLPSQPADSLRLE